MTVELMVEPCQLHVVGNWAPMLPPLEVGMVPVIVWPSVSVKVTDLPPTRVPKFQNPSC